MKRALALVAVALSVLLITACTAPDSGVTKKKIKVGMVANFLSHEFYQREVTGMKKEAEAQGVELLIADSNSDVTAQINNIENYISQKVDVLVVVPIDPNAIKSQVLKAKKAGIPTITESNPVEGGVTNVAGDWYSNGKAMGTWVGEHLKKLDIDGKVLIVGFPAFPDTTAVEKGFTENLLASGANVKIVASVDGQAVKEKSLIAATDALTAHPEINVIMGINDDSTLGAIQAYKTAGKDVTKLISITHGMEGSGAAKAMLEEGSLTAAMGLFPEAIGQSMIKAAVMAYNKQELPALYKSPMTMVTKDNALTFYTKTGEDYEVNFEALKSIKD